MVGTRYLSLCVFFLAAAGCALDFDKFQFGNETFRADAGSDTGGTDAPICEDCGEPTTFLTSGKADQAYLGSALSLSGDTLAVGALYNLQGIGAVRIFVRQGSGWVPQQMLKPPANVTQSFGTSVSLEGDVLVVGAPTRENESGLKGAVYVYRRSGSQWTLEKEFETPEGDADGYQGFGSAVSLSGKRFAVGAPSADAGHVYMFEYENNKWVAGEHLTADKASKYAKFGEPLDLIADRLVVGAPGESSLESWAGAVYVFERNGSKWRQIKMLTAKNPSIHAQFGAALSATTTPSGLSLAVGSKPLGRATAPVTVEMIRQDGRSWTYEDSFIPGQDKAVAFGAALSMHHNILAVGMAEKDDGHGLVYLMQFQGNSWTEITRFESPSDQPAAFGAVVELGANTLAVGAPAYSASESPNDNSGAVYMFQLR